LDDFARFLVNKLGIKKDLDQTEDFFPLRFFASCGFLIRVNLAGTGKENREMKTRGFVVTIFWVGICHRFSTGDTFDRWTCGGWQRQIGQLFCAAHYAEGWTGFLSRTANQNCVKGDCPPFNISRGVRWKFGCRSTAAGRSKCVLRLYSIRKLHISIGLFLTRLLTQLSWTFASGVKGSTLKATARKLPRLL